MPDPIKARGYRFGVFEADVGTGELRRQGLRVKLNAQPFQVLVMLMERPGELLTRDEISRELWPEGTFVDYEHGVNSAINRIREALGDTASSPRFVETLARRGYRFVAPVERIAASIVPSAATSDSHSAESQLSVRQTAEAKPPTPAAPSIMIGQTAANTENEETELLSRILATPQDLPKTSHAVVRTLFLLLQLIYLGFYIGALANLTEIEDLMSALPRAGEAFMVMIVTAGIMIPVRTFLLCAVLFYAPGIRGKFLRIWPLLLLLDVLWALSPFLLLHHINFGLALACTAPLVYSPFAQRSLMLMGAGEAQNPASAHFA